MPSSLTLFSLSVCLQKDLDQAERMRCRGDQLMMEDQYAVDSIRPKCVELQRMCEQYKDLLRRRRHVLTKSHDLHDRLDRVSVCVWGFV